MFDFTLLGVHFCWGITGRWWRSWGVGWGKEYFHNEGRFIPGFSVTIASVVLDVSLQKYWDEKPTVVPPIEPLPQPWSAGHFTDDLGDTIYTTPATRYFSDGSNEETTIRIIDAGFGWVVVWDDQAGIIDNFLIAGGKAKVSLKKGKLRLVPAGTGIGYSISEKHYPREILEQMLSRLRRAEASAAA